MITFDSNGQAGRSAPGETIWQVAQHLGTTLAALCYAPEAGLIARRQLRACMVGDRGRARAAPSCLRTPTPNMNGAALRTFRAETARHW